MTTKEIYEKKKTEIVSKIKKQIVKDKLFEPFKMLVRGYFEWDFVKILYAIKNIVQIPKTLYMLFKIEKKNKNFQDILLYGTTLGLLEKLSDDEDFEDIQKKHIKNVKTVGKIIRNVLENGFNKNDPYYVAILLLKFSLILGSLDSTKDLTLKALEFTKDL